MILLYLRRVVLIAAAAATCYCLADHFGVWNAVAIWATTAAFACSIRRSQEASMLKAILRERVRFSRHTW